MNRLAGLAMCVMGAFLLLCGLRLIYAYLNGLPTEPTIQSIMAVVPGFVIAAAMYYYGREEPPEL